MQHSSGAMTGKYSPPHCVYASKVITHATLPPCCHFNAKVPLQSMQDRKTYNMSKNCIYIRICKGCQIMYVYVKPCLFLGYRISPRWSFISPRGPKVIWIAHRGYCPGYPEKYKYHPGCLGTGYNVYSFALTFRPPGLQIRTYTQ